jgi:uncharacterized protein YaaR (DUF327 family)
VDLMAKIGQVGIGSYIPTQLKNENKNKKTEKKGKTHFQTLIDSRNEEKEKILIESAQLGSLDKPEALEELIDHLFESGEELKRLPVEEKFEEYKKNIRILINYVSNKSYNVVKEEGVINPKTFKQKHYVNVELINKKLDSLAVYIISRQKDQFELLRRVDEMNGLLINVVR